MRLRSVELELPRRDAAVDFLRDIWGLVEVARRGPTAFLRGAGDHPYLVALTEASTPRAASITLEGFAAHGAEAVSTSPEAFREFLPRDLANTAKVVKAAGLQAE